MKARQAVLPMVIDLEGAFARDRGVLEESWPRLMSVLKQKIVEPIFRERLIAERESKRVDIGASRSGNNSKRKVVAAPLRLYGVERKAEGDGIVLVYVVRKTSPRFDILTWMAGEREVRSVLLHCFLSYLMFGIMYVFGQTYNAAPSIDVLMFQKMQCLPVCDWTLLLRMTQLSEMGNEQQSTKISTAERIDEIDGIRPPAFTASRLLSRKRKVGYDCCRGIEDVDLQLALTRSLMEK